MSSLRGDHRTWKNANRSKLVILDEGTLRFLANLGVRDANLANPLSLDPKTELYFAPLLRALSHRPRSRGELYRKYLNSLAVSFGPEAIFVTSAHNNMNIYRLATQLPGQNFFVIQNGSVVDRPWSMGADWDFIAKSKFDNVTFFSWGPEFDYIFGRFTGASVLHSGPTSLLSMNAKTDVGSNRVVLVSQFRDLDTKFHQLANDALRDFFTNLQRTCSRLNLSLEVLTSQKSEANLTAEWEFFTRASNGTKIRFLNRSAEDHSCSAVGSPLVYVGIDSSLLLELSYAGGQVIMVPDLRPDFDPAFVQALSQVKNGRLRLSSSASLEADLLKSQSTTDEVQQHDHSVEKFEVLKQLFIPAGL